MNVCAIEELLLLVSVVIVLARIQEVTEASIVNYSYYYVLSTSLKRFRGNNTYDLLQISCAASARG